MGSSSSKHSLPEPQVPFSDRVSNGTVQLRNSMGKTGELSSAMRDKAELWKGHWTDRRENLKDSWMIFNLNYKILWFLHERMTRENVILLLCVLGGTTLCATVVRYCLRRHWLSRKRKRKGEQRQQALALLEKNLKSSSVSEARQNEIKRMTFAQLKAALQSGEVSSVEALHTYQTAALETHERTNCLVEPIWEAETWALDCDLSDEKKGPLHGMPISIKDNFGIEGYDCTVGLAQWIDRPFEDSVLVKVLKKQGAIPFVKTNVPQTMISWDTSNPIYGATRNPHRPDRGVGGSSGGEGALIAGGGSVIGVGGDIGGSIRIPCHLCGIYGFKPTAGRISARGAHPIFKGQNAVPSVYGPMAHDVETLVEFMRAMMVPYMWKLDPVVVPVPFREEIYSEKKKIRIGYYDNMEFFHAAPACKRAVREAKAALERAGYEVIRWDFPKLGERTAVCWIQAICGDRGKRLLNALAHDSVDHAVFTLASLQRLPTVIQKALQIVFSLVYPRPALAFKAMQGCPSVTEWWALVGSIEEFKQQVSDSMHKEGITAILSPGMACPAVPVGIPGQIGSATCYTQVYNVLNFPTGSVPVTKVTAQDDAAMATYPTPDPWHRIMKKAAQGSEGLPINVQISTLSFNDETCLRIMADLERQLNKQG